MSRAWMTDDGTTEWSRGCYVVQWRKNSSKHRILNRTPFGAVFGGLNNGLASLNLPQSVMENLNTEEELDEPLQAHNHQMLKKKLEQHAPTSVIQRDSENFCLICSLLINVTDVVPCAKCESLVHIECAEAESKTAFICSLCVKRKRIDDLQDDCYKRHKVAAERMKTHSARLFPQISVGDCVVLAVPSVDRGPLDFRQVSGIVTKIENDVYQIGTNAGIIKAYKLGLQFIDSANSFDMKFQEFIVICSRTLNEYQNIVKISPTRNMAKGLLQYSEKSEIRQFLG
ncbi:hypothetical protein QAD02_023038 [Eretmocerus hayati]|uniref:Uncharacterized protein n=1 Tax=Eretmocerus hayati TaxID=131215 RepID=A0ACC2PX70_9HYME|nr:hypothetical protein QAD02_023038 [Eretmocerus hayati]